METLNIQYHDKRKAAIAAGFSLVLLFLFLFLITLDPNDPPIEVQVEYEVLPVAQIIDERPQLNNGGGGGGGGGEASNDDVNPKPVPQTAKMLTNTHGKTTVKTGGESNKTTADNSKENPSTTIKSNNPFANGGNGGGNGGGVGTGNGLGFGKDDGDGSGPGNGRGEGGSGGGSDRIRIKDPNVDDIDSDVNHIVRLKVKINAEGNVIAVENTSKTTTTDQEIIRKVKAATITQTRYKKKPGAGIEEAYLTIKINAR
jgi:hypothetical protein